MFLCPSAGDDSFPERRAIFQHILLPTDGSKLSDKAAKQAIKTAKELGAKITAIHVMPDYGKYVTERL